MSRVGEWANSSRFVSKRVDEWVWVGLLLFRSRFVSRVGEWAFSSLVMFKRVDELEWVGLLLFRSSFMSRVGSPSNHQDGSF